MLASLILLAMVVLLVWFFADPRFFVYEADVQGGALVSADEVYRASGLDTMSIFYVNRRQVAENIRGTVLGLVGAQIHCQMPGSVQIRIREQDVRFLWRTRGTAFLVNDGGQVLGVDDGSHQELICIRDLDDRPLDLGEVVDQSALNAVDHLRGLLPDVTAYDYSRAKGISLLDARGWRIYFGDDQSLLEKVASMHAVLQKIASEGNPVKFIDLRFVGSPYYE
jgi:cell division septal protein FtsQ